MRIVSHHIKLSRKGRVLSILPTPGYILANRDPFIIMWGFLFIVIGGLVAFGFAMFWEYAQFWVYDFALWFLEVLPKNLTFLAGGAIIFFLMMYISGGRIKLSRADIILTPWRIYLRSFKPVWLPFYKKIKWEDVEYIRYEGMSYEEVSELDLKTKDQSYSYRFLRIPEKEKHHILDWLGAYVPEGIWKKTPEQMKQA